MDPLLHEFVEFSPLNYAVGKPVNLIDLDGCADDTKELVWRYMGPEVRNTKAEVAQIVRTTGEIVGITSTPVSVLEVAFSPTKGLVGTGLHGVEICLKAFAEVIDPNSTPYGAQELLGDATGTVARLISGADGIASVAISFAVKKTIDNYDSNSGIGRMQNPGTWDTPVASTGSASSVPQFLPQSESPH